MFRISGGSKGSRGMRVSSYDPDDPMQGGNTPGQQKKTILTAGQRVATISQNYNEKTMLLSSDDELQ